MENKSFRFPFEDDAKHNRYPKAITDLIDIGAWARLAEIYKEHETSKDANKSRLDKESLRKVWQFQRGQATKWARIWKETELAASACRKDPTPENALRLCDVLVGLGFKECPLDNVSE